MEETQKDPLDISQEVDLIKEAQKDLSKCDVLICGGCHTVFHFVEEFEKHKKGGECTNVSILKCENEEKTQIWGFTLWKCKQVRNYRSKNEEPPGSWEIYQKWTKLEQSEKDLWITGGRTLQYINKITTGKVKEIKDEKKVEKDPLAIDEDASLDNEVSINNLIKTGVLKTVTLIQGKRAFKTNKDNEKEEYNVEKIMGKRFNPRKRYWEYEVKWENYTDPSNTSYVSIRPTWEPLSNLENCKALVQEFEEKLKAEKEAKDKATPSRGRGRPRLNSSQSPQAVKIVKKVVTPPSSSAVMVATTPGGRPQRTSKQKALNQVKAWCGNMSDEEGGGTKRPFDDANDSDDSFEKKMKLEGDDEDTEEDEPRAPVRKIAKIIHTYNNNGAGKPTTTPTKLPENVLIPDAKGVVRISQKQLPSLSSGVYIMSKSSGIIKLDPTASKIATSGGQAIVKVSPKIGQTQIKIIKKEDGSKRVVEVKKPQVTTTTTTTPKQLTPIAPKPTPKVIQSPVINRTILKKDVDKIVKKVEVLQKPQTPKIPEKKLETKDEDSDDGIPDWEFPEDLPTVPPPESPPGDFILDPFTGKVAGVEYPDPEPEPVIKEDKPKPPEEEVKKDTAEEEESEESKLDNIVKLAAADITEDDLKPDENTPTTTTTSTPPTNGKDTTVTVTTNESSDVKTTQSILTTAIANSNILQKTLQAPRPKTQPRIINQSVAKPRTTMTPIVRNATQPSPIRPKQILPKPKFNIATQKTNNVVRKVNNTNTNVYKTTVATATTTTTTKQPIRKSTPQKIVTPTTPKPVISMPSLDEEPPSTVATPKVNEAATIETDLSTFTLAATDRPMFITGDDGTVYQVAGQNAEGQTLLLTHDSEGQQQCLLVTSEALQEEVMQVGTEVAAGGAQVLMEVQEPVDAAEEQPLVAQLIRTEPPSPGGTHKVVVMLPDGDVMVTQVTPEEYASLELDK